VVSGSDDKTVRVWSLTEKKKVVVYHGHTSFVKKVQVTADDQYLVSGSGDFTVRVWDMKSRNIKAIISAVENIFTEFIVSKKENAIYLSTGFGVSNYNIDKNMMELRFIYDKNFEEIFASDPCYESRIFPQILYSN
jgi:WD40 repeat protein